MNCNNTLSCFLISLVQGTVSIGGRTITNLRFADELASLVDRLDKTFAAFGMEIIAEKTKLMTNNANGITIDIRINVKKLDEVQAKNDTFDWTRRAGINVLKKYFIAYSFALVDFLFVATFLNKIKRMVKVRQTFQISLTKVNCACAILCCSKCL